MPERTEAQKRAQKKYMASFVEIKVRMTQERRTIVQNHAQAMEESATAFINRAINSQMARDIVISPVEAHTMPQEAGGISLPPATLKAAQKAAEAAGETVPVFIARAVETQAQRDKVI